MVQTIARRRAHKTTQFLRRSDGRQAMLHAGLKRCSQLSAALSGRGLKAIGEDAK
jgi:hypothetical protein